MKPRTILHIACAIAVAGCAQTPGQSPVYMARMNEAGDVYVGCMSTEAEKDMASPAAAEDIVTAAHGRCWTQWDSYRKATNESFLANAATAEDKQFALDKAEGHLREFEREV